MATVTSNVHLSDGDEPALRLFETYPGHFGISFYVDSTPVPALTLFGTLDQLEDVARQIERLVILARHDQEEDQVSLPDAGEAALEADEFAADAAYQQTVPRLLPDGRLTTEVG